MAAALVDLPAQDRKQVRCLLDFVENDQFVGMLGQIEFRFGNLGAILAVFEIEVDGAPGLGDRQRQGGLADLARPKQADSRVAVKHGADDREGFALNHACKYAMSWQICKDA